MSQCKDITLEKLKVRCSGLDSYFPGTRNIDKHPVWGGREVLSSELCENLAFKSQSNALQRSCHCNNAGQDCPVLRAVGHVPVMGHLQPRTALKQQLMGSEPGHLQVHQDPSRLISELLLQHEFESPEEGLHQLRKESLERDKGTMYLLIQWSFNTSLQPFNTSYAYALGR